MYRNLEAEIKRRGLSRLALAEQMGCNPSTISFKLTGKRPFTLPEAKRLKAILQVQLPLEVLFAVDAQQTHLRCGKNGGKVG